MSGNMMTQGGSRAFSQVYRKKIKNRIFFGNEPNDLARKNDSMEWVCPPEPAIIMGTSLESGDSRLHQKQISLALQRFGHFSVFCYSNLFDPAKQSTAPNHAMLLPFLKVLADASQFVVKLSTVRTSHPFRSLDIHAHPEESFPYDQLHFYDHVPPELAFEPSKDGNISLWTWRKARGGRWAVSASGDLVKLCRRTYRRKLQRKERNLYEVLRKGRLLEKPVTGLPSSENKEDDVNMPMKNWEVVKMSEATAQEENDLKFSSSGRREREMHMNEVHFSSTSWFGTSMAIMRMKLVSGDLRASKNQFAFRNGKSFGCISCAHQCSISNIGVHLVTYLEGMVKMIKCSILKLGQDKLKFEHNLPRYRQRSLMG